MNISAIVLTHDRTKMLHRTLRMLESQTMKLHEIRVAKNDGVGCGVAAARNTEATRCTGDWLLFTYDDGVHMHDAVESVAAHAEELARDDVLINVTAVDIFSSLGRLSEDELYQRVSAYPGRSGDIVRSILSGLKHRFFFMEQHCSLIRRDYFNALGGYDAVGFPGWSLHEQDLAMRVMADGGYVDSLVKRVSNGMPLFLFHQVNRTDKLSAQKRAWVESSQGDFLRKYGRRFTRSIIDNMANGPTHMHKHVKEVERWAQS